MPAADRLSRVDRGHLAQCARCAELAARYRAVEIELATPPATVVPPPDFALRVVSNLPGPSETLAWAALRLLPGAVALVLLLGWLSVTAIDSHELLFEPVDDAMLLTYPSEASS